jgi:hypothetical protein
MCQLMAMGGVVQVLQSCAALLLLLWHHPDVLTFIA